MPTPVLKQPQPASWQRNLADAVSDPHELLEILGLKTSTVDLPAFPVRVPRGFIARMERGNPRDPLLLQVLPQPQENETHPGFSNDPVGDLAAVRDQGLLQKYNGRVLIMATGACAVHCRYCFRRHFPYNEHIDRPSNRQALIEALSKDSSINEAILSGGDPLLVKDEHLDELTHQLAALPHIKRLRVHSRLPVVLPERITPALISALTPPGLSSVMVVHCNHANEIDDTVASAFAKLKGAGITLLNQAVLLKDINDDAQAQINLSERLFETGVMPYYLHMLDRVDGAAHFETTDAKALEILESMRSTLPGYLVPKLVRENAGAPYKTPITST